MWTSRDRVVVLVLLVALAGFTAGYALGLAVSMFKSEPPGPEPPESVETETAETATGVQPPVTWTGVEAPATGAPEPSNATLELVWTSYGYRASWESLETLSSIYRAMGGSAFYMTPGVFETTVVETLVRPLTATVTAVTPMPSTAPAEARAAPEYSTTNIQVAGIDEPDVVKTNRTHIAVLHRDVVELYRAYPAGSLSLAAVYDIRKAVLEIVGDENLVLVSGSGYTEPVAPVQHHIVVRGVYMTEDGLVVIADEYRSPWPLESRTWVISLDTSMKLRWMRSITGRFYDARLYNQTLVLVTEASMIVRPVILEADAGAARIIPVPEPPIVASLEPIETIVAAFSLDTGSAATLTIVGAPPSTMYMSATGSLYLVLPGIEELHAILGDRVNATLAEIAERMEKAQPRGTKSLLVGVSVEPGPRLEPEASTVIPGIARKQWMIDEYNGTLRIVVEEQDWSDKQWRTRVGLYILDAETLDEIGRVDEIVLNERVHAARFLGPRLYLVTFRQIDPLFVIDLADPRKPRVLGYIEAPGFDEYLHPVNNTLLIGVGREDSKVRISLYKVMGDAKIKVLDRVYIGGDWRYAWSHVLDPRWGHRAFTLDMRHGYVMIPVEGWSQEYRETPEGIAEIGARRNGVAIVKLDTERGDLELRALLLHMGAARSLYIGDTLYTVAPESYPRVKAYDAETLEPIAYAPRPTEVTVRDIRANPESYSGKPVVVRGVSLRWTGLDEPPPVTRSDWVLDDGTRRIYVAAIMGPVPGKDEKVTVIGIVRLGPEDRPYIEPVEVVIAGEPGKS
ncbi:hypothetical protein Pyrde_0229 [Pyrodictium delaneyi]|uniref:Beta propeller domain protein n=1 Tax=Pyrodictium delaneyi TaxID=1273541 RepID=A0A0P0N165_9CREN|nr:beta-propeller domain-containing protein [Pyrodictium delaneyi]ALL00279.1 hypothetical protein Pyrde_0229 [Pyrodictium delaneyi]OWJ54352.1 hypothetical protein Pdsh_07700 [Pyrodictium delaneyi]